MPWIKIVILTIYGLLVLAMILTALGVFDEHK